MQTKIKTTRFGEILVTEAQIINFPSGLIGFPEQKQFALIEQKSEQPFCWLQSTKDPDVAFVVVDPDIIKPEYVINPTDIELRELELSNLDQADVFVVITVPEDPHNMTANLKAPILVNKNSRNAKQIVLNQNEITTRYFLIYQENENEQQQPIIENASATIVRRAPTEM